MPASNSSNPVHYLSCPYLPLQLREEEVAVDKEEGNDTMELPSPSPGGPSTLLDTVAQLQTTSLVLASQQMDQMPAATPFC